MSLSLSIGILGQVCYLIVSILDLCTLTYYDQLSTVDNTGSVSNVGSVSNAGSVSIILMIKKMTQIGVIFAPPPSVARAQGQRQNSGL